MAEQTLGNLAASAGIGAAMNAGQGIVGTLLGQAFAKRNMRLQTEANQKQMDYQFGLNKQMAAINQQYAMESAAQEQQYAIDNAKNAAKYQVQGLQAAGLNPALLNGATPTLAGASAGSGSGQGAGLGSIDAGQANNIFAGMNPLDFANTQINSKNAESNRVISEATARKAAADAQAQEIENKWKLEMSDYAEKQQKALDLLVENRDLTNKEIISRTGVNEATADNLRKYSEVMDAQIERWHVQNENEKEQICFALKKLPKELEYLSAQTGLAAAQGKSILEQLPLLIENLRYEGGRIEANTRLLISQRHLTQKQEIQVEEQTDAIMKQIGLTKRGQDYGLLRTIISAGLAAGTLYVTKSPAAAGVAAGAVSSGSVDAGIPPVPFN